MDNNIKIIILNINDLDVNDYITELIKHNENFVIAKKFTTDIDEYNEGKYEIYLDLKTLSLAYKNNSFLYVTTNNNISHGITIDEYYTSDIIQMNIEEFNLISDYTLGNNFVLCWIDKSKVYDYTKINLNEIKILENRLEKLNYLYFLNSDVNEFVETLKKFINATDEEKQLLFEEFS